MTITRNYHGGGGTLTRSLCNLPKGGGADDRTKRGSRLPVPGGGLPFQRECDTSIHELARHQLGAGTRPDDIGSRCQSYRWQHWRLGGSDADRRSAAENQRSYLCRRRKQWGRWQRLGRIPRRHGSLLAQRSNAIWAACAKSRRRIPIRQCILIREPQHRRRPAPQQHAALPRSVHLAADCVTPERGCAAA